MFKKIRKVSLALLAVLLIVSLASALLTYVVILNTGMIKAGGPEDPLEAWSEQSFIVWQYNSTFFGTRNMSTLLVVYFGTDDDLAIQWGIDNCSSNYGGSVYVKCPTYTGTYNAEVTLKDKVTLIIEQGALGITVTIDTNATATLLDYAHFDFKHWDNGVLSYEYKTWHEGETASYVIWRTGDIYYAKNGTSGATPYSGTSITTVMGNSIDDISSAGGGAIYIRRGEYTLSATIDIMKSNINIFFERGAKFTLADGANCEMFIIGNMTYPIENIRFSGGEFDGNANNQNPTGEQRPRFCAPSFVNHIIFEYIYVHDFYDSAIDTWRCQNVTIQHFRIEDISIGGDIGAIYLSNCRGFYINDGCINHVAGEYGIRAYISYDENITYGIITNINITNTHSSGMSFSGDWASHHLIIAHNFLGNVGYVGGQAIYIDYCTPGNYSSDIKIIGNTIDTVGNNGIIVYYAKYVTIVNNHIFNTGGTGIYLQYVYDAKISGGIIRDCGFNGIDIHNPCNYTTVIDVTARENISGIGILDGGTDTHVTACWNGSNWISTYP